MEPKPVPTIRDLYPTLTDPELKEAEENIERYLAIVLRIFERQEAQSPGKLTPGTGTLPCTPPRSESSPASTSP